MRERKSMVYAAAVNDFLDINQSFAWGKMRIAYHGRNNNGSHISKAAFEASMSSLYNRPIVAHYIRETDSIGGHDVAFVKNDDGLFMYNVTEPVGVVPESASTWWEMVEEADGTMREYLCCDIIVWKRQQAFSHLQENRVTDESMEIEIIKRHYDELGEMHIDLFEFTAFCLLERDRPCFPSADIELFSFDNCRAQFTEMMEDFRKEFSQVITASADDIDNQFFSKGGDREMNIEEMLTQYGLSAEDITFDTEGLDQSELELRFAALRDGKQEPVPVDPQPEPEVQVEDPQEPEVQQFSLTHEQFMSELLAALRAVEMDDPWFGGKMPRYWYVDCDTEAGTVYAYDGMDDKLYGYPFAMNGDNVLIDFAAGKRMKWQYVEFDEGETNTMVFSCITDIRQACKEKFDALNSEMDVLAKFKSDTLREKLVSEQQRVFAAFEDLVGNDRFDALRADCGDMPADELEEKCYAIRGRMSAQKFSASNTPESIRLPIEGSKAHSSDEPYGGIFAEYGIGQ